MYVGACGQNLCVIVLGRHEYSVGGMCVKGGCVCESVSVCAGGRVCAFVWANFVCNCVGSMWM